MTPRGTPEQPDFTGLFFAYFKEQAAKKRPLSYRLRHGGNLQHDLIFASSLVHDATFRFADIKQSKRRLKIDISRDCWERRNWQSEPVASLPSVASHLQIDGVIGFQFTTKDWLPDSAEDNLSMVGLRVSDNYREMEQFTLRIQGDYWNLDLLVEFDDFALQVQDVELPTE